MFSAAPPHLPVYLMHGFGDFGDTETTIEGAVAAVANALSQYLKGSTTPQPVVTQPVIQPSTIGGISPIYLIGGGLLAWYLIKKRKGVKAKKEVI